MASPEWRTKLGALGERVRASSSALASRVGLGVSRARDYLQGPTAADKLVEAATAADLPGPDWQRSLELCDGVNGGAIAPADAVRAIKRRLASASGGGGGGGGGDGGQTQLLALTLLETALKNCERLFAEVAAERVLDDMVRLADDPATLPAARDKALRMIEAWGEAADDLRYLPVFEQTYKVPPLPRRSHRRSRRCLRRRQLALTRPAASPAGQSMRSRGVRFPGRDDESLAPIFTPPQTHPIAAPAPPAVPGDGAAPAAAAESSEETLAVARNSVELLSTVLTSAPKQEALKDELTLTLVAQCRQSQRSVQSVVDRAGDNESLMFEALSVHDDLDRVLKQHADMSSEHNPAAPDATAADGAGQDQPAQIAILEEPEADQSEGLVRNRRTAPATSAGADEEAMANLDSVIFGNSGAGRHDTSANSAPTSPSPLPPPPTTIGSRSVVGKKDNESLIEF
eukprot:SM000148S01034  [mRNA]  locus=s148:337038:338835:+ [translate_table: standard]